MKRFQLKVKDHIDAAHYIRDYAGKCSREHGHRWDIEVVIEGSELNDLNMLEDFKAVKDDLDEVLSELDHYQLNEVLSEPNVTAEYLAKWLFGRIADRTRMVGTKLFEVSVWESPDCCVTYYGEVL